MEHLHILTTRQMLRHYKWTEMRMRGNLLLVPGAISRTIEIYDPVTGDLIASNTSALSTTWTARH